MKLIEFKNKIFALCFLILLFVIFVIFGIKRNISYKTPIEKKITNTERLKTIKIYENDTLKIYLKKRKENWYLNENFDVRKIMIENIITNINNIEVTQPVPFSYAEKAQQNFKNYKRTLRIYNKLSKVYEISFYYDTLHHKTICYYGKNNQKLFFIKIRGEQNENLLNFIPISEDIYIEKILISLYPEQIKKIKIEYPEKIDQSFEILINNINNIELYSIYPTTQKIKNTDIQRLKDYLYYFYSIKCEESNINKFHKGKIIARLYIEDVKGTIREILLFEAIKPNKEVDKNYCYAEINNNRKLALIYYYDIDPIMREIDELIKK